MKLESLFEAEGLPAFDWPPELDEAYGSRLGFERPRVVANFVTAVDGVVALAEDAESGGTISGGSEADHFVMGMLRACADVVMVGAGTLRKADGDRFDAESICPAHAASFAEARRRAGLASRPRFAVLTRSGDLDPTIPALDDALVVTTARGQAALRARGGLRATTEIAAVAAPSFPLAAAIDRVREGGARIVLCEGGPTLFAELVAAKLVDELFLTISPRLFGHFPNDGRKALTHGIDLAGAPLTLLTLHRAASHVFARYSLR